MADEHRSPTFRKDWIFQDYRVNRYRPRTRLILTLFRLAQAARWPFDKSPSMLSRIITLLYQFISEWILAIEIPVKTNVGSRLKIVHGHGLVVNVDTVIGSDVTLRQNVTIGNKGDAGGSPTIGDGVDIGATSVIIGPISIGKGARIGAGAVVIKDVPAGHTAVGNPARNLSPERVK